jgi:hypothetical protein
LVDIYPAAHRRSKYDPESTQFNAKDAGLALLMLKHLSKVPATSSVLASAESECAAGCGAELDGGVSIFGEQDAARRCKLLLPVHETARSIASKSVNTGERCAVTLDMCFSSFFFSIFHRYGMRTIAEGILYATDTIVLMGIIFL